MNQQEETVDPVIVEYFKELRQEIKDHIKEMNNLFWIKLIALGASLAFFASMINASTIVNPIILYCMWIIPVVGIIFDMNMFGKGTRVMALGKYIRIYFEGMAFEEIKNGINKKKKGWHFMFWEEAHMKMDYLVNDNKKHIKISITFFNSENFVSFIFTVGVCILVYLLKRAINFNNIFDNIIFAFLLTLSIVVVTLYVITSYHIARAN